jgi:hypothetical protein
VSPYIRRLTDEYMGAGVGLGHGSDRWALIFIG